MPLNLSVDFIATEQAILDLFKGNDDLINLHKLMGNPVYERDLSNVNVFKLCEYDEYITSIRLPNGVYIDKYICHRDESSIEEDDAVSVLDFACNYDFITSSLHIAIYLKENYKMNVTVIQVCKVFHYAIYMQFAYLNRSVEHNTCNFLESLMVIEVKFGYKLENFNFDEWAKINKLVCENLEPIILEFMQDKKKINSLSYECLMNILQTFGKTHRKLVIDKDPDTINDDNNVVVIQRLC